MRRASYCDASKCNEGDHVMKLPSSTFLQSPNSLTSMRETQYTRLFCSFSFLSYFLCYGTHCCGAIKSRPHQVDIPASDDGLSVTRHSARHSLHTGTHTRMKHSGKANSSHARLKVRLLLTMGNKPPPPIHPAHLAASPRSSVAAPLAASLPQLVNTWFGA